MKTALLLSSILLASACSSGNNAQNDSTTKGVIFDGPSYDAVLSFAEAYGAVNDAKAQFKLVSGNALICRDVITVIAEKSGSGTSGYADFSFKNPDYLLCKYRLDHFSALMVLENSSLDGKKVPIGLSFGIPGAKAVDDLPINGPSTGNSHKLTFDPNDNTSMISGDFSDVISPSDRSQRQFVIVPQ